MNIELHVIQAGVDQGPIPSYASVNISPVFCDYGTLSFTYPKNGKRFATLLANKDEIEIVPYVDGVAYPRFGGLVQEVGGDDVAEAAVFDFTGVGYLKLLDEARVYPNNWPSVDPLNTSWKFVDATAGTIIRTLVLAAQGRGSLSGVTTAFTNTTDTNGVTWNKTLSVEITPGVKITDVVKNLHDQGMCEFVMNGRELRVYVEGGLSVDRTVVTPPAKPLTFRKGRDLKDSPRKTSSRDVATVMLAAGKDDTGIYHEEVDTTAVATRRRIEGFVSNGNITDAGTLNSFSEYSLSQLSRSKMEKTHGLEFVHPKSPRPILNFDVGDWCYSDTGNGTERLRIKQWVLSVDASGRITGSVTLNDLFAEFSERLSKRIEGIIGGTTITGESRAEDVIPSEAIDLIPPKTPTGFTLSSSAYTDERSGQTYAQVGGAWFAVTQNIDDTAIEDLAGYQIRWRYTLEQPGYRYLNVGVDTVASWSPVTTDVQITAAIRAFDKNSNFSDWSTDRTVQTAFDTTPPAIPSAGVVDNYLGLTRLTWNGKTASGAAWAADFNYVEVHASTVANFTASDTTHIDSFSGAGRTFARTAYGTATYFKMRAVDHNGNKGSFSTEVSGTSTQVVNADVFDGAIGSSKLADLAVTTAKINDLAVNNAKIGSMDVAKLTAGILNAQVTISGRIATALTGARREMNGVGFQAFDASENLTINLNGVDNLLTGKVKTGISGRRVEIGTNPNNTGTVRFISPSGELSEIGTFSSPIGEVIRMGPVLSGVSQFWGKTQLQSDAQHYSWSAYHKICIGGDDPTDTKAFDVTWAASRGTETVATFPEELRMNINSTDASFYIPYNGGNGGSFWVNGRNSAGTLHTRFRVSPTHVWFQWNTGPARIVLMDTSFTGVSGRLQLVNQYNFGSIIRFYSQSNGASSRIDIMDAGESIYLPILASSFEVASSQEIKEDITEFSSGGMDLVRQMQPKRYRRKPGKSTEGEKAAQGAMELGFTVEGSPSEMLNRDGNAVDLYATLTAVVAGLRETDARLDALEAKKGSKK